MEGAIDVVKDEIMQLVAAQQASMNALFVEQMHVQRKSLERALEDICERYAEGQQNGLPVESKKTSCVTTTSKRARISARSKASRASIGSKECVASKESEPQQFSQITPSFETDTSKGKSSLFNNSIDTHTLDVFIGITIMVHICFMSLELQSDGYASGVRVGLHSGSSSALWELVQSVTYAFEHVFNAVYALEFAYRFRLFGCRYFKYALNIFDFLLVVLGSADLYVLDPLHGSWNVDVRGLRFVRFLKVLRALRIVKAVMCFHELRVLLRTIFSCTQSLGTCMGLLMIMMLLPGILVSQLLQDFIRDDGFDIELRREIHSFYGNAFISTYTFFEMTMSGCWPNYVTPVVKRVSSWYLVLFIPYITFVVFAVIRIITALFLKATMDIATSDAEMVAVEQMQKKEHMMRKLRMLFEDADESGDGLLTLPELESLMEDPKVKSWLNTLGLEVHETKLLFHLIDDGDGYITADEFLRGVGRLKGSSRAMDTEALRQSVEKVLNLTTALYMREAVLGDLPPAISNTVPSSMSLKMNAQAQNKIFVLESEKNSMSETAKTEDERSLGTICSV
eukprot:TRINITY_DN5635_c0_g4_i1.p1 TRINITY_DN5635_c0_g4~~TRINITY_DN5635_c0_g4_i1.p1  ORF type:complete len:568 (+),score=73.44 TRINITY_DN5635_c0_g4_i1:58-1761(+)